MLHGHWSKDPGKFSLGPHLMSHWTEFLDQMELRAFAVELHTYNLMPSFAAHARLPEPISKQFMNSAKTPILLDKNSALRVPPNNNRRITG
uniref:Uncharacterized protein n=1 Tax=Oryza punctata TaxID=4537 RepID=A0A0E0KCS2_ORYPU